MGIYPNPTTDLLTIDLKELANAAVEVISIGGQVLISQEITDGLGKIDMKNLSVGFYIIKLFKGNQMLTKTVI